MAIDESFLQNRQLMAHLQANQGLAFSGAQAQPAPTMMRPLAYGQQKNFQGHPGMQNHALPQQPRVGNAPVMPNQMALMQALAQHQFNNGANTFQNNNPAVNTAAVAAAQQAQVRAAQAQARATVANMLQQQERANQQAMGPNGAFNNNGLHITGLYQRPANNNAQPMNLQNAQQQQMTMVAATQIVQQYQAQQADQARRAQILKNAQQLAFAQQQQFSAAVAINPSPAAVMQALLKQAQLKQEAQQRALQQQQQLGGYPFSQAQQAQAHAQAQAQAQAHVQHAQRQAQVQLQAQAQARHNMQALACLTPAQLQALSTNPALAQALLQARSAAQQQNMNQQHQISQVNIAAPVAMAAPEAKRASDPRFRFNLATGGMNGAGGIVGPPDFVSPVSSNAGSPPPTSSAVGVNMSKEQRRTALACVALQLARSGMTVDQAIHSGIMGGMSVMDVSFIVEVYNKEVARVKAEAVADASKNTKSTSAAEGDAVFAAQQYKQAQVSRLPSSDSHSSYAGSETGLSALGGGRSSRAGSVVDSAADLQQELPFDAFTYGFFGEGGADAGIEIPAEGLLGELESELESCGLGDAVDMTADEQVWMQEQHSVLGMGSPTPWSPEAEDKKKVPEAKRDDVAERLANLDLGYGFF